MIEILNYKAINKNSLQGTFSVKIAKWGNFIIKDMSYFVKGDQRWVSFPSRAYEKDGEKKYFQYMTFEDPEMVKAFQNKVIEALDAQLKSTIHPDTMNLTQEEIPF